MLQVLTENLLSKGCYYLFGLQLPLYINFFVLGLLFYWPVRKLSRFKGFKYLIILAPAVFIFIKLLRNEHFFFSDDFAHLKLISEYNYKEILNLAFRREGLWVNHHIVLGFWLFKLIFQLWGVNIFPYNLIVFVLNSANILLFYVFLNKIKRSKSSILISVIFATFYISWISNIHELLGALFLLSALISSFNYFKDKRKTSLVLAVLFYLLAIATKEITFLFGVAFLLMAAYYHFSVNKLNLKEFLKVYLPVFGVFLAYLLFVAWTFTSYFAIEGGVGYQMKLSADVFVSNLAWYFSDLMPAFNNRVLYVGALLLVFLLWDLLRKKVEVLPFVASYFLFLGPPLFFTARNASYYNYIPSIFLLAAIYLLVEKLFRFIKLRFSSNVLASVFLQIYLVVILLVGIFRVNEAFQDACFLIQNPWDNVKKDKIMHIAQEVGNSDPKVGEKINFSKEKVDELEVFWSSEILHLFLKDEMARKYRYIYKDGGILVTNEK